MVLMLPSLAPAHPGIGATAGFCGGLAHPLTGLDHMLAMVAVGLWAAQCGGRATWFVPLAFGLVMIPGSLLGMAGISIPFAQKGIIASVLVFGVLAAAAVRLPLVASSVIVGLFALFHGHAHGAEMPATASGSLYSLGFLLATMALQCSGIAAGLTAQKIGSMKLSRYVGGAIAVAGLYLVFAA
jgi:urease accessory protein